MRKRDLGILLLAAFAIFFSLQHEGDFSFREAWYHLSDDYPIKYEAERLPPPIVADLNGDGRAEVLVATHDAKIQVLEPHARRVDEGFSEARLLAEVSLLPDKVRISSGRRPVAMATGFVDRTYKHGEIRKQVLVVVTSGWSVMCFDHNLKKLWEANLQDDIPHGAHIREIAISISNYTLKHGDAGLVIVGGRMDMQPHLYLDPFEEVMEAEKNSEQHRRSAEEKEVSEKSGTADLRHFSFYAFAGRSGKRHWSKKSEDVQPHSTDATHFIPQHNYKLDAHSLNSRRPGEMECREFRESILGVMPHRWERREDTSFKLAHFRKHKRKLVKKMPGKGTSNPFQMPEENHAPGKDSSNKISRAIGKAADYATSKKGKKNLPYVPTITNHTQLWWVPNVIVAHQKEGIEAVHIASGRTVCKVVGGNGAEQNVVSGSMEVLRPCLAVATSGVPVREQLFNVSICHRGPFNFFHHGEFSRSFGRSADTGPLEVAAPILIRRDDGHRHRKGSHGDVVFLTSRGEVTSYTPGLHGHDATWRWQLLTGASWSNLPSPSGMMDEAKVVPTLKTFPLRTHGTEEVILVAGEQEAVVISPGGSQWASIDLPSPPSHALVFYDFSNDGLTDIILVSPNGVYGFVQTRQPGALFFSTLVGCLIVLIGVFLVTQHLNSPKAKPRVSSDYR
ncbi:hypothetical protein AMTRI_Chr09g15370 [Amborella trichopoda]